MKASELINLLVEQISKVGDNEIKIDSDNFDRFHDIIDVDNSAFYSHCSQHARIEKYIMIKIDDIDFIDRN